MQRVRLTLDRIRDFNCPDGVKQAFLWDSVAPRLAVRATAGKKAFIFEGKLKRQTIRRTVGDVRAWGLDDARVEANRLQVLLDQGVDPREVDRQKERERQDRERAVVAKGVTFLDAWEQYIEARRSRWSSRYLRDHHYVIAGKDVRQPLACFVSVRLVDLTADRIQGWLVDESRKRPTQAACAFRKLRAFGTWCSQHNEYVALIDPQVFKLARVVESVPKGKARDDCLQREMLRPWFDHVRRLSPLQSSYLQILLLTGARRDELATLRWENVDFRWQTLRIKDKTEGERTIPLTPYVEKLLRHLEQRNNTPPGPFRLVRGKRVKNDLDAWEPSPWVFASRRAKSGRLENPANAHHQALADAGLPAMTLHGLRRSFGTLSEWIEVPVGVVAQIQGHKPSALVEKHYRQRPIDLLRKWHTKIEDWILTEAGVEQPARRHSGLRAVQTSQPDSRSV